MHFVVLGTHAPEICPTSNAKTRELITSVAPDIPKLAEKNGVNIVAGPYVNREHLTVVIVEADKPESLDAFLLESRLPQWNTIRIIPSVSMQEGMAELEGQPLVF